MLKRYIKLFQLLTYVFALIIPTYMVAQAETVKDYFQTKNWKYPLNFKLQDTIYRSPSCGVDAITQTDKNRILQLESRTDSINNNIRKYFTAYFHSDTIWSKWDSTYGLSISNPIFCVMDTLGDIELLVTCKWYRGRSTIPLWPLGGKSMGAWHIIRSAARRQD